MGEIDKSAQNDLNDSSDPIEEMYKHFEAYGSYGVVAVQSLPIPSEPVGKEYKEELKYLASNSDRIVPFSFAAPPENMYNDDVEDFELEKAKESKAVAEEWKPKTVAVRRALKSLSSLSSDLRTVIASLQPIDDELAQLAADLASHPALRKKRIDITEVDIPEKAPAKTGRPKIPTEELIAIASQPLKGLTSEQKSVRRRARVTLASRNFKAKKNS